jgi:hypothetical protein
MSSNMRLTFLILALGVVSAPSCGANHLDGSCMECHPACSNGLVTRCLPLLPPGCGAQPSQTFCPGGCSADAPGECNNASSTAPAGCIASAATTTQGALAAHGSDVPVAVTTFLAAETRIVVSTSAGAACSSATGTTGALTTGSGALLAFEVPSSFAGTVGVSERGSAARLTSWKNGAIVADELATLGTIMLNLQQPGGGTMGSYDLVFPSGREQGTFVAPACDICTRSP